MVEKRIVSSVDKAHAKYSLTEQKSRDLMERQNITVEYHKHKMEDKFFSRDEAHKRVQDNRTAFIKRESARHNQKVAARERIMHSISVEQTQRKEVRKLRVLDNLSNLERERKKTQEFKDFWLKKEFIKNAVNQEISSTANQLVNQAKVWNNSTEVAAVH